MVQRSEIGRLIQARRQARHLTQEQLSRLADIPYATLTKVESGAIKNPSSQVISKLARVLEITVDSLLSPQVHQGEFAVKEIWRDVLQTLQKPGDYMCLTGISEKQFINLTEGEIDQFIATLKERGVSQRIIISDADNTTLAGNHLEYRSIPQELFNATPQYVYGDTVAFLLWGPPQQALIIKNATLADAMRKQFLFMWHYAKPLERDLVNSNC